MINEIKPDQRQAGQERAREELDHTNGARAELAELELRLLVGVAEEIAQKDQHE